MNILKAVGLYTLLAPTNTAVQVYKGFWDEKTLSYHIILGDVYWDEFRDELETLVDHSLTCKKRI